MFVIQLFVEAGSLPIHPLLAQMADPISGGAGWIGAGLLGVVLAWLLLLHLPAKDKQLKEMIEGRDALAKDLAIKTAEVAKQQRDDFKENLKSVTDHCKQDTEVMANSVRAEINHLSVAVTELRKAIDALSMATPGPGKSR